MKTYLLCEVISVIFVLNLLAVYVILHSYRFPPVFIRDRRHIGRDNNLQHNRKIQLFPARSTSESFHVFSAVAILNLTSNGYDSVFVNVWYDDFNTTFKCCFKYANGNFNVNLAILFHHKYTHAKVYKCVFPLLTEDLPYEVSLLPVKGTRPCVHSDTYTRIDYPKRHKDELALCVKPAYGQLDPKELICWIEFQILMGVDKIFFLVKNIDDRSLSVLDHYSNTGIIQLVNFTFQKQLKGFTEYSHASSNYQRIATFDCQERMRGYSYAGLLDIDEYMIPKVHRNLKDLIKFYIQKYNNTAGITFLVEYFFKEWGKQKPDGVLDPIYYFERSEPLVNRVKSIHIPERTKQMSVTLHDYRPTQGYRLVVVESDIGTVHHYRECPREERFNFGNCSIMKRYTDRHMLDFKNMIEQKVWKTLKAIKTVQHDPN